MNGIIHDNGSIEITAKTVYNNHKNFYYSIKRPHNYENGCNLKSWIC